MRKTVIAVTLILAFGLTGCSSFSLPSLPSLSWKSTPPPDPTVEALFEEGMRYFKEKRYARAIDVWQKIKTDHPFSPVLTETELKMADAYYLNKQYPEAIAAFKEFQSLHPTNENMDFVLYRLGQAHFDQFSATDREQKNTDIARGHFETLITTYPKSPYVADARAKLAKTLEYLAESEFNVASFYFQQEKYPAARDRFEEIVRKYRDTPTAIKSLFYLGETYRKEKNGVKAALAYEALLQHYPTSKFAAEAKTQLAQVEKEKHDPLAMLLMRDRRVAPADNGETNVATAKSERLKGLELIAKNDVVHEEPGDSKSMLRRVVNKINPFASSSDAKKQEKPAETAEQLMMRKRAAEKNRSGGMFSWLNPFSGKSSKDQPAGNQSNGFVSKVDDSLQQKGIDVAARQSALKPPAAELPPVVEEKPSTAETSKLLAGIDSSLNKAGKSGEMPSPPELAEAFKDPSAAQAMAAKAAAKPEPSQSLSNSGLLGSIDQKLKSQGLQPEQFEAAPAPPPAGGPSKEKPKAVELEPKISLEKGPLFLSPAEVSVQEKTSTPAAAEKAEKKPEIADKQKEPGTREIPASVVRAPAQPPAAAKPAEPKKPEPGQEEEPKGFFEQLKDDAERVGRILNPFRW
jgi:outer membrane protein assembly factor BamD